MLNTNIIIDDSIIDISGEEELIPQGTYFYVTNAKGLNWEGFADSKAEVEARFPGATVTEWEPTEFVGIWML